MRGGSEAGISVRSGGTDVHLVLVDLRDAQIDGKQAEDLLHEIHNTINRCEHVLILCGRMPLRTFGMYCGFYPMAISCHV